MGPLEFLLHFFSFLLPALVVALLVAAGSRLVLPRGSARLGWWAGVALNFAVGAVVLVLGLWTFGRDGKMATYAALVAAIATAQWLNARGWRA